MGVSSPTLLDNIVTKVFKNFLVFDRTLVVRHAYMHLICPGEFPFVTSTLIMIAGGATFCEDWPRDVS